MLKGIPVMADGHTRAVVAIQSGIEKVPQTIRFLTHQYLLKRK